MMYLLTPPTAEPVTISDARLALRLDDDAFDALLPGLIAAARAVAEQETRRQFVEQTWRAELADWPACTDVMHVHRATACSISYWSGGAWQTLAGAAYAYAPGGPGDAGTVLAPAIGATWPTLGEVAIGPRVRIDLTAGVAPAAADSIPAGICQFIVALVGQMLQAPDLNASATAQAHPLLQRLLDPWRLYA